MMGAIALWAVSLLICTSCEDEHNSVMPTFGGFRLEPVAWHSGDSVTVTAVQQSLGELIYRAKYSWKVECAGTVLVDTTCTVVYDNDKSDPYVGVRLPENLTGRAEVTFKAEYNYSARSPKAPASGTNNGQSGLFGNIRTTANSELYGMCSGSVSNTVQDR